MAFSRRLSFGVLEHCQSLTISDLEAELLEEFDRRRRARVRIPISDVNPAC
jgi:hypothetical protein